MPVSWAEDLIDSLQYMFLETSHDLGLAEHGVDAVNIISSRISTAATAATAVDKVRLQALHNTRSFLPHVPPLVASTNADISLAVRIGSDRAIHGHFEPKTVT